MMEVHMNIVTILMVLPLLVALTNMITNVIKGLCEAFATHAKIIAPLVAVALSLLAAMVTFLFCVASAVCELGCIVLTLLSLILFVGGQTVGGIVFLVLAFLVSPFGVPAIAEWLVDRLHSAKFTLRDFITG